ncbi:MAG: hypothetical protein ABSE58_05595 [Candidatus Limnocylindrales bacterium]|jgi:hypothetical protein
MRVDRGRLNWGIFFIFLGAVPLAYHQGVVSSSALGDAWRLWPFVLVGIGLGFVLSRTPAFFVGGLVVAACLGLVFGSVLAIGPNLDCGGGNATQTVSQTGSFAGAPSVQLDLRCGSATIGTSGDGRWHVDASNSAGNAAQISYDAGSLHVSSATTSGWSFDRGKDNWQIALPQGAPIDLNTTLDLGDARFTLASANLGSARFALNMGTLHVDLSGATVGTMTVSTNLGAAYVTLDGSSDLTGDLKTNLGSLDVCVPAGLGVQVSGSDSLSSSEFGGAGLVKVDGLWKTPNYDTAAHKANLTFETSLGSLKFHPAGGCK